MIDLGRKLDLLENLSNKKVPIDPKTERHFFELCSWRDRLLLSLNNIGNSPIKNNFFFQKAKSCSTIIRNQSKTVAIECAGIVKPVQTSLCRTVAGKDVSLMFARISTRDPSGFSNAQACIISLYFVVAMRCAPRFTNFEK